MEPPDDYNYVYSCPLCDRLIFIQLPDADAPVGCTTEVEVTDENDRKIETVLSAHFASSHVSFTEDL
jgi:hypothetical protein